MYNLDVINIVSIVIIIELTMINEKLKTLCLIELEKLLQSNDK